MLVFCEVVETMDAAVEGCGVVCVVFSWSVFDDDFGVADFCDNVVKDGGDDLGDVEVEVGLEREELVVNRVELIEVCWLVPVVTDGDDVGVDSGIDVVVDTFEVVEVDVVEDDTVDFASVSSLSSSSSVT